MFVFQAPLVGDNVSDTIQFEGWDNDTNCRLCARYREDVIEVTAMDFFDALCRIRETLGRDGFHPLCSGASLDVYPTGSTRKRSRGLLAYHLTMGRAITEFDLVLVFDGLAVIPATVPEQRDYYDQWLQSVP
ncbi:hypothetical protein BKK81_09075 [Cupriavidus sp. USMAHM13]|uniref:Uncharacterized protein n=1 Tax=Cupriavidus malaysiensis TaxID=367825 RepID=A0ABN4TLI7_9BURK|nr:MULTISPECIES: hypothetical protein [Cupriavidus]AOY99398.1 hypothetical protein BKK81_09075 [Cupriavidus sp. USMAHM13]AOZ06015.1 hypothetical protein BKK80_09360 [Cupriavidus malaysiensis]